MKSLEEAMGHVMKFVEEMKQIGYDVHVDITVMVEAEG